MMAKSSLAREIPGRGTLFCYDGVMKKKKEQRLVQIRQILEERGTVRTRELAEMLEVTPETLRTDLDFLESQNLIEREHGIARLQMQSKEVPLEWRRSENLGEKTRVARRALEEVKDGDVVFVDAGSTLLTALDTLSSRRDLTIVVNSLPAADTCLRMGFHCVFIGGEMMRSGQHTYGFFAEDMIDHIRIDVAIMGTTGIQGADGFCVYNLNEVGVRRHIIRQSQKLVVMMDAHKLEQPGYCRFCTFREPDLLVTNPLTPALKEKLRECRCIVEV